MNLLFWKAIKDIDTAKFIQIDFKITHSFR